MEVFQQPIIMVVPRAPRATIPMQLIRWLAGPRVSRGTMDEAAAAAGVAVADVSAVALILIKVDTEDGEKRADFAAALVI